MPGFLFDEVVFGPVHSRRLGVSLGINLLPVDYKFCTFDCVYCECGWTHRKNSSHARVPGRKVVRDALDKRLTQLKNIGYIPDAITFAGNGEPTIHPKFAEITEDVIALRNEYFPQAKVSLLSNSTMLHKPGILEALKKIDNNILKLDAGTERTFRLINRPMNSLTLEKVVENLKNLESNVIIQTLFLRGEYQGEVIDNTTEAEIAAWLEILRQIRPRMVMIYPIDRATPTRSLVKISEEELMMIAGKVEKLGIKVNIYG